MPEEIVYSAQEVADRLKIKKNTVYNMIKRGEIVAYRIGNKVRVSESELKKYMDGALTYVSADTEQPTAAICDTGGTMRPMLDEPVQKANGFIICGQDAALDALANQMQNRSGKPTLRSYVGSYNGLTMLYKGEASIASSHLWDAETNTYNVPFLNHLIPGVPTEVIHLFKRTQGFYVASRNPKRIQSWEDLGRKDIVMVNREKGSGTRVLLDGKLRLAGIDAPSIEGYGRECFSHLSVAGVVARGGADVGVGTQYGAKMIQGIDFVPLQQESYDLVVRATDMNQPMFSLAIEIIRSREFRSALEDMKLYDLSDIGTTIART
ncbi:MAG: helix-turn-helix transcriptional regulator [Eubacteriales bacterium]